MTSVTSGTHRVTYRAHVQAPSGYKVKVSPSTIRLRGGESATFTVTVTNKSGPVEAWRFGSLTWKGEGYSVRSPIAVKAALFRAPDAVSGTGASGTASFDVKFGYTGSYTAGAHGLIKSTLTQATVLQDPNQDFDPADVAAGGANLHTFTLAMRRTSGWPSHRRRPSPTRTSTSTSSVPTASSPRPAPPAAPTSTSTSTTRPTGTWKVYVHGWQTIGTDSDYTMWSWIVPNATGGSLTIDSAPASAVTGATGTVTVGWTGLERADRRLVSRGGVAHRAERVDGSHVRRRRQPLIDPPSLDPRQVVPEKHAERSDEPMGGSISGRPGSGRFGVRRPAFVAVRPSA